MFRKLFNLLDRSVNTILLSCFVGLLVWTLASLWESRAEISERDSPTVVQISQD